jgi:hypothetical protein
MVRRKSNPQVDSQLSVQSKSDVQSGVVSGGGISTVRIDKIPTPHTVTTTINTTTNTTTNITNTDNAGGRTNSVLVERDSDRQSSTDVRNPWSFASSAGGGMDRSSSADVECGTATRPKYACEDEDDEEDDYSRSVQSPSNETPSNAALSQSNKQSSSQTPSQLQPLLIQSELSWNPFHMFFGTKKQTPTKNRSRRNSAASTNNNANSDKNKGFFGKFYVKLGALPLVFLFIRFWGSMRIILTYANYQNKQVNEFFAIMQAFFDPSQGFFNAILFVFLSTEDRQSLYLSLAMIFSFASEYCSCFGACSAFFASTQAISRQKKLMNNSNTSVNSAASNPMQPGVSGVVNGKLPTVICICIFASVNVSNVC